MTTFVTNIFKNMQAAVRTGAAACLLTLCGVSAMAQGLSNRGKEFWVGYGHHQFMEPGFTNSQNMVVYLSAEEAANVTISIDGTAWSRTYNIPANTVIVSDLIPKAGSVDARLYSVPPSYGGTGGEGVFSNKGIHIISDVPIVAYAHIYGSVSSGATMLMPVSTWGYSYISLNSQQSFANDCFSWMYVVAKEDNTMVEINPSESSRNGRPANVPFTVTLNRGDIYQLVGAPLGGGKGKELTGTTVRSIANASGKCFPIAVFSGSSRTSINCPGSTAGTSGDNNMQQVFPYQAWGKRYLTAPISGRVATSFQTNLYKVVVKDPSTVVKRNGVVLTGLSHSCYEFISNTADYIEADKPVLLAQFMASQGGCPNTTGIGDPEMIYLSPIEQATKKVAFYRNNVEKIEVNGLLLVIPDNGIPSLKIDGQPTFDLSYPHPNLPGYTVVVKRWTAAAAQCTVQSDSAFNATTYGLGDFESYGYNAGTFINNLNAIGQIHNQADTSRAMHPFTCVNTPLDLSVLLTYQPTKLEWQLSKLGANINPAADVLQDSPAPAKQLVIEGVQYYQYTLPQPYRFPNAGYYDITVLSTAPHIDNCNNTEEVNFTVAVKGKPDAVAAYTFSTACELDTAYFAGKDSSNGYKLTQWKWVFPGGVTSALQQTDQHLNAGTQAITLAVATEDGCVADTSFNLTVYNKPVADFAATTAAICAGSTVTFNDKAAYVGTAPIKEWNWDFGNGTSKTNTTNAATTAAYTDYKTYTVSQVVKVSDLCVSDTVKKTVTVYAAPVASFTYPDDCITQGTPVQFTSTATASDGQAIATYTWDFGDANATPVNPNTSTVNNPLHSYTYYGSYKIRHSVTTVNGCVKDTLVTATFNVKPVLTYASIPAVCESVKGTVSIALAGVTNGVTGAGIYRGPYIDAAGNFNPSAARAGTHTVTYVFTADSGCKDSVTANVNVLPAPLADFSLTADVCLGSVVTITDQSTVGSGSIITWNWQLGDGTTATQNNNNPFSQLYTAAGTYAVKLSVVSDNGCVSDTTTKNAVVHALPVANFNPSAAICMPEGNAVFTNLSTAANTYEWNFGDGSATATDRNPSHVFTTAGSYNVTLSVVSAYGCTHDTTKTLSAFFNKPTAAFTASPDTLCQGTDNFFADNSTVDNGAISAWSWEFGDGSSDNIADPVKRYQEPGAYTVQLTVTSTAGCISEPFTAPVTVYLQPVVDAGPSFVVAEGSVVQFAPVVNNENELTFRWTPATDLSNPDILRPVLTVTADAVYTLTATGLGGCTASDDLSVKVFKEVKVPNAFSPNGDGINDTWVLTNLSDYPECSVEIFNRYGQKIFQSTGYKTAWDGTMNGHPLPLATYYYVIKIKNGSAPLTGYVVLVR
ncbi:T9SS C-terminal target domain-containing protein [Chitinophaga pinensis]|uniref:PKD domain containing protein n=1 Tax=Chitinophaga pinensis (strain ATCC 43595 / DSM 2588 / LMG 13176 / NBRC 15968 / NCIMB 11800 / UQM 2034) TaxID=485918 RepID=A0A979G1P1_CHIPD|nr:T9SS C-terminal target domain-containing protein [Chitinophaga pinensis]ACU59235.1 PKD domain containing protein [Chitinophaga pinensis DSM 2588]